jgi:hypothetical protein
LTRKGIAVDSSANPDLGNQIFYTDAPCRNRLAAQPWLTAVASRSRDQAAAIDRAGRSRLGAAPSVDQLQMG